MAALLEVRKGQARIKPTDVVHVGRGVPAQEHLPVVPGDATRRPMAVKTIGAVMTVCSSRLDTKLYKKTSTTKAAIVTIMHLFGLECCVSHCTTG
jgi:hypothetical protein